MSFQLANLKGAALPRMVEKVVAAGQSFLRGAALLVDSNDNYAECGADPAAIAAIANSDYGTDATGFIRTGHKEFPVGYMQGISVAHQVVFSAEYVGTLPAAAGGSYGIVKGGDGKWRVDFTETVNTRLKLVSLEWTRAPLNRNRVLVEFLTANVQLI
jgi:hypothetical protein